MEIKRILKKMFLATILLFSIIVSSQESNKTISKEELKNLHMNLLNLNEKGNNLQNSIDSKLQLLKELDSKDLKGKLQQEIDSLKSENIDNKIKVYEIRSDLPKNDPLTIDKVFINIEEDTKVIELKSSITYLKTILKLGKKDSILLKDKIENLGDRLQVLKREIIEVYSVNDKKSNVIFSDRNLDVTSSKVKSELKKTKKNVIDKFERYIVTEESKLAFKNSKITYRATIFNTYFTVPIARFNQVKNDDTKDGNIQLFNSVGAGMSYRGGRITDIRDSNGELIDSEFNNTFGVSLGVIFSAGSANGDDTNVFAPVLAIDLLDFQLGYGIELGTREANQKKGFFTIAYAIPLYKLFKGKYRIIKKGAIINDVLEN